MSSIIFAILLVGVWLLNYAILMLFSMVGLHTRFSKIKTVLLSTSLIIPIICFRFYFVLQKDQSMVSMVSMVSNCILIGLHIIVFRGKWLKRVYTLLFIFIFSMAVELLVVFILSANHLEYVLYDFANRPFQYAVLSYYPAYALILYPLYRLICRVNRIEEEHLRNEWMLMLFPISIIAIMLVGVRNTPILTPISMVGFLLGTISSFFLSVLIYLENHRHSVQHQLEEQNRMMMIEQSRYEKIMLMDEQIHQIRHDYRNRVLALNYITGEEKDEKK